MNHYVYKITDKTNKKFYFGSRSCKCEPENDNYLGSPCVWKPNKENLEKLILVKNFDNRSEAISVESKFIKENIDNELNENYYIPNEGFHTAGKKISKEHKQKLKDNHANFSKENHPMWGRSHTEESKKKMSESSMGSFPSKETRKLLSKIKSGEGNSFYNKKHTKESKKKMSESAKNRTIDPKIEKIRREKISKSLRGRKHNKETKEKLSKQRTGKNNPMYGIKGKSHHNSKIVIQYDLENNFIREWANVRIASDELNINKGGIYNCCNNKTKTSGNFKWKYK